MPIGNLTSQFFANVYLNELDQYVKHVLKCRHYLRYVDDFVLLHQDRAQLAAWREDIARFLGERLGLALRDPGRLRPASDGVDFLGYVVRRDYRLVRRRVVHQLREKLDSWSRRLGGIKAELPAAARERLRATLASYLGHFGHADSARLIASLWRRYPWLGEWFAPPTTARSSKMLALWEPRGVASLHGQWRWFRKRFPTALTLLQVGNRVEIHGEHARHVERLGGQGGKPVTRAGWPEAGLSWPVTAAGALMRRFSRLGWDVILVCEEGWLRGGLKRRVLRCRLRKRVGADLTETEGSSTRAQADRRETQRMKETK